MELIERYVHEVGTYLPRQLRDDVSQELRSNLEEALTDRLQSGDWKSDEEAEIALLEELGAPHLLADSYVPRPRVLFGPRLYPAFILTMKIVVAALTAIAVLRLAVDLANSLSFGALIGGIVTAFISVVTGSLMTLGVVVVVFSLIERTAALPTAGMDKWDPRSLPAVDDPDKVALGERVASIVFLAVALVVVNTFPDRIRAFVSMNEEWGWIPLLGPAFDAQVWLLNTCLIVDLLVNFLVLLRWRWTTPLRWANFATNLLYVIWLWRLAFGPSIIEIDPEWMLTQGWSTEAIARYQEVTMGTWARMLAMGLRIGSYAAIAGLAFQLFKLSKRIFNRS